jgi:acyl-homoserine lactone acylase PvdQ
MRRPIEALIQSYSRTKAADLRAFKQVMELHANASNNTVFADASGNIAYFHSNYIPRRDTTFDWTSPVDGGDPRTDYHGVLGVDESPNAVNPASGWVFNSNDFPWFCAGTSSPRRQDFPRYVETGIEETPRGVHALRLLGGEEEWRQLGGVHTLRQLSGLRASRPSGGAHDWTLDSLTRAAFDSKLPAFDALLVTLLGEYAWHGTPRSLKRRLAPEIKSLQGWDQRWGEASVPTTLAIYWGERMLRAAAAPAAAAHMTPLAWVAYRAPHDELLSALVAASDTLTQLFGTWKTPWGKINRFQRIDERIEPRFDDAQPSLAVPFTSGIWGSLASFGARPAPGTRKWYGNSGNSFVAAVEFGDTLRAIAVTAGGASGHLGSPHFTDQAERYIRGDLREVYFHPWQLAKHTTRTYHPGE